MPTESLQLDQLVNDPEVRRAAAKTLKGFCLTYLPHHFPADLSDFFDEMAVNLQDHSNKRLEVIGFRGCAKSTMASLALVLWCALEHPEQYPFVIMLADNRPGANVTGSAILSAEYPHRIRVRGTFDPRALAVGSRCPRARRCR